MLQELLKFDSRLRDLLAVDRTQLDITSPPSAPASLNCRSADVTPSAVTSGNLEVIFSDSDGEAATPFTLHLVSIPSVTGTFIVTVLVCTYSTQHLLL